MNKDELTALKESIEHWERLKTGEDTNVGSDSCALCNYTRGDGLTVNCDKCPIMRKTGHDSCDGTPYNDYYFNRTTENAQRMIDFLKSLLPEDDMKSDQIDFSKPVQTRDGQKFEMLWIHGRGTYPIVGYVGEDDHPSTFTAEGYWTSSKYPGDKDLINVPETRVVWVNAYPDGSDYQGAAEPSKKVADTCAGNDREARIRVEYTVGQFDE